MRRSYAVTAIGRDQSGIVASIGEALLGCGSSIDDSSMTILGGHFAMLLLVDASCSIDEIKDAIKPVADRFELTCEIKDTEAYGFSIEDRDDYVVAAYGPDKQGLVSALSRVLADANANITDFGSHIGMDQTFAMWFNVTLDNGTNVDALKDKLSSTGKQLGLDVRVDRAEAEAL